MTDERMGLAGTLALLAATVAVIFGVALTRDDSPATPVDASTPPSGGAALNSEELLELSLELTPQVARRVERIRGLKFDEIPEPQVTDSEALRELAEEELAKPKTAKVIAAGDAELKLLGLLDPEESLADVSTEVTADAAAYYDPKEKELFLLGDAVPAGAALAEFVLAHELDHALEDQAFSLPASNASNDDAVLAESALVEGSATSLMTEYAARYLEVDDLLNDSGAVDSGSTDDLPPIALAQVTFSYFGGQRFVDALRAEAGGTWDLVDFAYEARLPETTEQILHAEKYYEDEGALPVEGPPSPGTGWTEVDSGAVGEFVTREILRQEAEEVGADEAAAGWGGDRYRLFQRDGTDPECTNDCRSDYALAIMWRSDSEGDARELHAAVSDYVERVLGGLEGETGIYGLDGGAAAVTTGGDQVALALAPDEALAERLARLAPQPVE